MEIIKKKEVKEAVKLKAGQIVLDADGHKVRVTEGDKLVEGIVDVRDFDMRSGIKDTFGSTDSDFEDYDFDYNYKKPRDVERWADSHETSQEIAYEIMKMARNDMYEAERIWADPSRKEMGNILDNAWRNTGDSYLQWGDESFTQ